MIGILGALTKDRVLFSDQTAPAEKLGGSVYYGALALNALSRQFKLFPMLAKKDAALLESLAALTPLVHPIWTAGTTVCHLHYSKRNRDERRVELEPISKAPDFSSEILDAFKQLSLLHVGTIGPHDVDLKGLRTLKRLGIPLAMDLQGLTRSYQPPEWFIDAVLDCVSIVKLNDQEAVQLFGDLPVDAILNHLHDFGVSEVLLTAGSRGAWIGAEREVHFIAAEQATVTSAETTGCGDLFTAVYLAHRERGPLQAASLASQYIGRWLSAAKRPQNSSFAPKNAI